MLNRCLYYALPNGKKADLNPLYRAAYGPDWWKDPALKSARDRGDLPGSRPTPAAVSKAQKSPKPRAPKPKRPPRTPRAAAPVSTVVVESSERIYDPREEQMRAQTQAIYESKLMREFGVKHFRDPRTGRRIDTTLTPHAARERVSAMFAMGTSVGQRHGRIERGSRKFTPKSAAESALRASPVWADAWMRNRQDYEETLALGRKAFYRVVPERTAAGVRFFVWPLAYGAHLPGPASPERASAEAVAAALNRTADPRRTGQWWTPPPVAYNAAVLSHWLPPAAVFSPTFDLATGRDRAAAAARRSA